MIYNGKIIVLAFPDTFVQLSDELMCKILPLVGLGTRTHIKAGHAALVLIENKTGKAQYFDFGRYITPPGKGRVRGAITDIELHIPFLAQIDEQGQLKNLDQFLLWLDAHPDKTHGSGRLVASLCEHINYELALRYILELQSQGSIPYKAFGKVGSNCARFVTETILAATSEPQIIKRLNHNKKFTPSTVGNVEKSATEKIFEVSQGRVRLYHSSALRENLTNYFDKRVPKTDKQPSVLRVPDSAQLLRGTGSSAWFELTQNTKGEDVVRRYTESGALDFEGNTVLPPNFDPKQPYAFVYDSNCAFCTVEQANTKFRLELYVKSSVRSNLVQRVHSA
ncbi:MAG: DUF6695 family protein [Dokdonia sp.]